MDNNNALKILEEDKNLDLIRDTMFRITGLFGFGIFAEFAYYVLF